MAQHLSLVLFGCILGVLTMPILAHYNLCLEQVSSFQSVWMQEHPLTGYAVVGDQPGMMQLIVLPKLRSTLVTPGGEVWLDIRNRTAFDGQDLGLHSFAFHPNFLQNGRFFVSYTCNATTTLDCVGACGCTVAEGCPATCAIQTVVAEYSAGTDSASISVSKSLTPTEVRKILHFGRPNSTRAGGQIWFGTDGYLYFASGDSGIPGQAQTPSSPFGKILRVDVDNNVAAMNWGNYSVPADNPYVGNAALAKEVYALGFRNPWRCSVDPVTNTTICGDAGEHTWEEVDIVSPGANCGWPLAEGPNSTVTVSAGSLVQPVLSYQHPSDGPSAVVGGYVYRGTATCLQGMYVFGDFNGSAFVGSFPPLSPGTVLDGTNVTVKSGSKLGTTEYLLSWAVDRSGELYRLSTSGIYRIIDPSYCGMVCDIDAAVPGPAVNSADNLKVSWRVLLGMIAAMVFLM